MTKRARTLVSPVEERSLAPMLNALYVLLTERQAYWRTHSADISVEDDWKTVLQGIEGRVGEDLTRYEPELQKLVRPLLELYQRFWDESPPDYLGLRNEIECSEADLSNYLSNHKRE